MITEELDQLIETLTGIRNGRPWQFKRPLSLEWEDPQRGASPKLIMSWCAEIRLKPWTLPPPPEGREWHRGAEFTEADLPEGYRPLLVGEDAQDRDECWKWGQGPWVGARATTLYAWHSKQRTKRPLPVGATVAPGVWCGPVNAPDPYAELKAAHAAGKVIEIFIKNDEYGPDRWSKKASAGWPLPPERYRVKPDPVPLGPEDVPPGSIIRKKGEAQQWHWRILSYVDGLGMTCANRFYPWKEVMNTHEILRPNQDWQPCSKPQP